MPTAKTKDPIDLERSTKTLHEEIDGMAPPRSCDCCWCKFPRKANNNPGEKFDYSMAMRKD